MKSVWVTKETFRLNFFGSIIKLTHIRHHKIEALEMVLCTADQPTMKANIGQHCFIHVSLQHSSADGPFRWAWLSHRFLNNSTHRENNPEPELNHGHFLIVRHYLRSIQNYIWNELCCGMLRFFSSVHSLKLFLTMAS